MVAPVFGFSVGDFIAGTQLLVEVFSAFKEAGGASSKYISEVSFLNGLNSTLQHLEKYVSNTAQNDISKDVEKLVLVIREPLDVFKKFLDKYEASLGASSTKSTAGKALRTIRYTMKDLSGMVKDLRRQIEQPLQAVNPLLSLQVIHSLERLPGQLLKPAQCALLVDAIRLADIPVELDKQIGLLQRTAAEHNVKQDEQLQVVTKLRTELDDKIASLSTAIDEIKDNAAEESTAKDRHEEQLAASEKLEETIKEQQMLLTTLKSFLEDKASMGESVLTSDTDFGDQDGKQLSASSWALGTLPAAHSALVLLSSVVSSIITTSVVIGAAPTATSSNLTIAQGPKYLPSAKHSPTSLGSLSLPRASGAYTSTGTTSDYNRQRPSEPEQTQVADWLSDWSRSQKFAPEQKKAQEMNWGLAVTGDNTGWSRRLSKLSDPETTNPKKWYDDTPGVVIAPFPSGGFPPDALSRSGAVCDDPNSYSDSFSGGYSGGDE
ncbi:hypothetical protein B0O99DRAFT_686840 [Bisporella sp. PMI_857]|nr:hypothetical protein B0O99DRAFT_686840 [Bisporella sp. PMI_857]